LPGALSALRPAICSSAISSTSWMPPRVTPTFLPLRSLTLLSARSERDTRRAPPLAKPATTKIGALLARPEIAASEAVVPISSSPAMIACITSSPLAKIFSSTLMPHFGAISLMYETAP
jgi:hypothetical protein